MTTTTQDLADRLLVYEAALDRTHQLELSETCHVCEKLRRSLGTLLGPDAYYALAARALSMAKREAPTLNAVQVKADGSIKGLIGEAAEANNILVAHLIGLMVNFIGETVTLWLLNDMWPNLPGDRIDVSGGTIGINQPDSRERLQNGD